MRLASEVLRDARQIINTYDWCQRANARDAAGRSCRVLSPDAVAFSLYGAVMRSAKAGDVDLQQTSLFQHLTAVSERALQRLGWTNTVHQHPVHAINDYPGIDKQAILDVIEEAAQECDNTSKPPNQPKIGVHPL